MESLDETTTIINNEKERNVILERLRERLGERQWDKLEKKIEKREKRKAEGKRVDPIMPKYKMMNIKIEDRVDKFEKICRRKEFEYNRWGNEFIVRDKEGLVFIVVVPQFKRMSREEKERLEFLGESGVRTMIYRGEDM